MRVHATVAVLAALLAIPASAASPPGRIVFVREVGDRTGLFSIRPNGSGLKRLTPEPGRYLAPVWSPAGNLIASFDATGIVIRAAGGRVVRRIPITVEGFLAELQWSPDGRWLSYLVERCSYEDARGYVVPPCGDLWVTTVDGSSARRLLDRDVDMLDGDASYSWSPGGGRLVYEALATGRTSLGVVDLRSGTHARIPRTEGAADPDWSPRGRIAFASGRSLFTLRPDGRSLRRLARGRALSRPSWSPDGRRLAYLSAERPQTGNRWGVWVARADGRSRRRLATATEDRALVWSPDSSRVLWENFGQRLVVAHALVPGSARLVACGSDPDWR